MPSMQVLSLLSALRHLEENAPHSRRKNDGRNAVAGGELSGEKGRWAPWLESRHTEGMFPPFD